ncbi:Receptor-type tyrosine-protein phosphatase T, partial [Stegodyphus mimosarum]
MTTNLIESGKVKCEKYWPDEANVYGEISVEHQCTYNWADFTVRTFCISKGQESREIKHYHFTTWPDHGVPANTTPFVNFLRKARAYDGNTEGPVVIHCSAGIGRTGTIILLDSMIEMGQKENHVDLLEQLCAMRRQ